jgi:hypothetical protein
VVGGGEPLERGAVDLASSVERHVVEEHDLVPPERRR